MNVVTADKLTKTYKNNRGITELDLAISEGSVYGLLGPNGSGKTTTMKVICGLQRAQSGSIRVFDRDPSQEAPAILARTSCLIETPGLYGHLTAEQNLRLLERVHAGVAPGRIDDVLRLLEIETYRNEKVSGFSLGMKQRLAIAMALLPASDLLVLDEPGNGMDISGMALLREILHHENEMGRTILISSHLAYEIEQICTELGVMREGRLIASAQVEEAVQRFGSVEAYYLWAIQDGRTKKGRIAS